MNIAHLMDNTVLFQCYSIGTSWYQTGATIEL